MNSENSSNETNSKLADAISAAKSPPSFSTEDESDSLLSSDLPPQPPPIQRIGAMSIPAQGWSLLRLNPPDEIILYVAGEQLRVVANGRWEPREPLQYLLNPPEPPLPEPNESHLAYARRYLAWSQPARINPEWLKWNARKTWIGETAEELRQKIEAEQSLPDHECFLTHQPHHNQ